MYVRAECAPSDVAGLVGLLRERVVDAYPNLTDDQIVAKPAV